MADTHYRLEVSIIGRATGQSALASAAYRSGDRLREERSPPTQEHAPARQGIAAAAYRSGDRLHDEQYGKTHDYRRKQGVVHTEILTPEGAPTWAANRQKLWNAVEKVEKRKDAQLAREVLVSLPRELTSTQHVALVRRFVGEQLVSRGMVADIAIHCPKASDGKDNPHAHILLTLRNIGPEGFGLKNREWNHALFTRHDRVKDPSKLVDLRATWANYVNQALADAGSAARVDHRSNEARALPRLPEPKLGYAHALKARDIETRRYFDCLRVRHENRVQAQRAALLKPKAFRLGASISIETGEDWMRQRLRPRIGPPISVAHQPDYLGRIRPPPGPEIDR